MSSNNSNLKHSLSEVYSSIQVSTQGTFWNKLKAYIGPGFMVAVGYMDPGNWATDIEGGSRFGYTLISVILVSNIFAMILQHLALKLGIATDRDLAQACKESYSKPVVTILWILTELAIAATDLAEVLGSAIALKLLFGLPLSVGIIITAFDVLLILLLQNRGFRLIEIIVAVLMGTIFLCFGYEIFITHPDFKEIAKNLIPKQEIVFNPSMLYISIGILGATVMPHNLYLHSSIVQTRNFERNNIGRKSAIKFATIDSTASLFLAFFVNAAILIMSAATFHFSGNHEVAGITEAFHLLDPLLGDKFAAVLFAVALLAAGQNSTLTGTLSGQIVMEGFMDFKMKPWLRRLLTRLLAIVPALFVILYFGEANTNKLLVISQVILSLQLSFAVIPLVVFTSDVKKMGVFVNSRLLQITSWIVSAIILILNIYLLYNFFK